MSDDVFVQAILSAPDDDTPRLTYADWLEEHGRPERAAFIRVECQLARLPDDDPRRPDLEARERQLLAEHGEEWAGPLRGLVDDWTFRRGFVEDVVFSGREPSRDELAAVSRLTPLKNVTVIMVGGGGR
jgi:uncharacterized protein (TIGR02996 family)